MNYYQITTGIDDDDSDLESDGQARSLDPHHQLHNAVHSCLSQSTVDDLMMELSRNSGVETNNNSVEKTKSPVSPVSSSGVLMRKSSGRSYSQRASQRFSRLLEGVSSLVSMTGMRGEETPTTPGYEETSGPASLPYWVEASQIISKVSRRSGFLYVDTPLIQEDSSHNSEISASDSGYSSIAESAQPTVTVRNRKLSSSADASNIPRDVAPADLDKIEEKISEIFDSLNVGKTSGDLTCN